MAGYGGILALLGMFAITGASGEAPARRSPQLRGSQAKPGEVVLRVVSKASFPITLANCEGNFTVPPLQEYVSTVPVPKSDFFWVVPEGAAWDCETGCSECFFLALGVDLNGGLWARLGYESNDDGEAEAPDHVAGSDALNETNSSHGNESQEPLAITGVELIATSTDNGTRASSSCGSDQCLPDWEQDHSIAWQTTMELIVRGSTLADISSSTMMPLVHSYGWPYGGYGGYYGGRYGGRYGGHYGGHYGGYGGYGYKGGYRPPVWRRPVWKQPRYPTYNCFRGAPGQPRICS